MERFGGSIEEFSSVNVSELVAWIKDIGFETWPQQRPLDDGQLRPAMVSDREWFGFGAMAEPIVQVCVNRLLGLSETDAGFILNADLDNHSYQWMLSVVMPGHEIEPHVDGQAPYWKARVHVPLTTNAKAVTIMDDGEHHMKVGKAYLVNTMATHAVANRGKTPRIHFMFDVRG